MKMESLQFTEADFDSFITDYLDRERELLVDRLQRIVAEVEELLPNMRERTSAEEESWSAVETLGHMVTSAQFFGYLSHEIATNKKIDVDILEMLKMRDVASSDAAQQGPEALVDQLGSSIERTITFLRSTSFEDLRATIQYFSREMTAEDIIRISLASHLESHVEQIREAVGG